MNIDSIKNGIVIDHITAGKGMEIYRLLGLEELDCSVALIKNVASKKCYGKHNKKRANCGEKDNRAAAGAYKCLKMQKSALHIVGRAGAAAHFPPYR